MSGNRWDRPGVPHLGWTCTAVEDLREGKTRDDNDAYATCEMCLVLQCSYAGTCPSEVPMEKRKKKGAAKPKQPKPVDNRPLAMNEGGSLAWMQAIYDAERAQEKEGESNPNKFAPGEGVEWPLCD